MKKLVLALVVLALVGALAFVFSQSGGGTVGQGTKSHLGDGDAETPPAVGTIPAVEKPLAAAPKKRTHAADAPTTLAVAGVVVGKDGAPLAGAVVEAYAIPEGDDLP